jgi:hypothetical protein
MKIFRHRKLPLHSNLLIGKLPSDNISCKSQILQIWYNKTNKSWVGEGEILHKHEKSDECFIVLEGILTVLVNNIKYKIGPREYCFFPKGMYHAITKVKTPVETIMIRAPSIHDKVYKRK